MTGEAKKKHNKSTITKILGVMAMILLWCALTGAGYWYAKQYVSQTAREIQETNALNVKALEEQIQSLRVEMKNIEEALAKTDRTLSDTGSASEEVNKRIIELDKQLKNLEQSIIILGESGNADY